MKKELKIVYFVTLVIKHTITKKIQGGLPMRTQQVTIVSDIHKTAKNNTQAYNWSIIKAQKTYHEIQIIAYTITELKPDIFILDEEKEKIENELNTEENA